MKRKILIVLLILIPILTVTLIYIINKQNIPVFKENVKDVLKHTESETASETISVTPTPILPPTISELMTELESGVQSVDEERLFLLIEEESALGYYSNLVLANRYDNENKDGSMYYWVALELYYN
ncbi:MAG: lytic transglycosylase, partial [Clostridiaceae bacterium]|nr:lytic transglycosylase [Clostridiaceae bacterium]